MSGCTSHGRPSWPGGLPGPRGRPARRMPCRRRALHLDLEDAPERRTAHSSDPGREAGVPSGRRVPSRPHGSSDGKGGRRRRHQPEPLVERSRPRRLLRPDHRSRRRLRLISESRSHGGRFGGGRSQRLHATLGADRDSVRPGRGPHGLRGTSGAEGAGAGRETRGGGDPDTWNRIQTLAATVSRKELLELDDTDVLRRLFHQEEVRASAGTARDLRLPMLKEAGGRRC